jgi:glycosyltransferase involved in cell wall biosynthesis
MSRIAWYSNACHIPSGYGTQTAQVVHQMVKDSHEVAVLSNFGAQVSMDCSHGHPIIPEGYLRYSVDSVADDITNWIGDKKGFAVTLFDVWTLVGVERLKKMNLACWTPIDHQPVPELVAKFIKGGNHQAIAMSRFGEDELSRAGVPSSKLTYIPHGIDRAVFSDKGAGARQVMGIPQDAFLVITNAANRGRIPVRKAFGEMADAMSVFMKDRPDVYWLMHTEPNGHSEGVNIPRLIAHLGIDQQRVRYPQPTLYRRGIPPDAIAAMYSSANVQLLTSMGEGFGIPVVEGQACGTPSIVSDFSAQPELIGSHSKKVPVQRVWDEFQASFFGIPNVPAIVNALQEVYEETKAGAVDRAKVSSEMERYDQEMLYASSWKPLISLMSNRKRK